MTSPTCLRVEHLAGALGLTTRRPRMSWQLPVGSSRQLAYRLQAGAWDSGRVDGDRSLLVPYEGPRLESRQRVEWRVKVWTEAGESEWATGDPWEMGILEPDSWVASAIGPQEGRDEPGKSWRFRATFDLVHPTWSARLRATAHGIYEFFINGRRVGDLELTPGFTSYDRTLQVQTYDVSDLLHEGTNVLGAVLSGGWASWAPLYRHLPLSLFAQLDVLDAEGDVRESFGTGPDWTYAAGALRTADLRAGCVVDLRSQDASWSTRDDDVGAWASACPQPFDLSRLTASPAPPVRRVQDLRPVNVTSPRTGVQVFDLGQNINGWVRLTKLGPAGNTLRLLHGEALGDEGEVTIDHLWGHGPSDKGPFQRDRVTSAGRPTDVFEPRHVTHGFRYVQVEGHSEELTDDDLTGVVVHTDLRRTGWFECSDERLNRLHEAVVWSFRGNACDIPTDCPTRERAGWTGDWQTFVETASFLYDVAGFTTKWLRDLAADQSPDGLVRHCAPEFQPLGIQIAAGMPPGSAGFADAAVIVPWKIYRAYADRDLLDEQWRSMRAWVDYAAAVARDARHPSRVAARPKPAPHEQYLWDTGFHWGDWNDPGQPWRVKDIGQLLVELREVDHGNLGTAYLFQSARLLAEAAAVIGRDSEAAHYRRFARRVRHAWRTEFLSKDGRTAPHTQASYVRALAFELVPRRLRRQVADHLVELVRSEGMHLTTGFLATPDLLPVLADSGHSDIAYALLQQDSAPSWLTMIERGATTLWEHWSGLDDSGHPQSGSGVGSLNHFSKGSVASFMHRYIAGIRLVGDTPGYRRFRIAPVPGGGLTSARARLDSPYGAIESSWTIVDGRFCLDVRVPPGTTAFVELPDGEAFEAAPGHGHYECELPTTPTGPQGRSIADNCAHPRGSAQSHSGAARRRQPEGMDSR
jgi:alpha-L-rhamnosidase